MSLTKPLLALFVLFASIAGCDAANAPDPATPTPTPTATSTATSDADGGACLGEGEGYAAFPPGQPPHPPCCAGLELKDSYESSMIQTLGKCLPNKGGHASCVACGDGKCGPGENKCNCPADCGS